MHPTGSLSFKDLEGQSFKEKFLSSHGAILVDVRTPGEFGFGSIVGANNIDFMSPSFKDQFLKLDREKEYFLFCQSGTRSRMACTLLAREGYTVYNLDEGIDTWPK